MNFPSYETMKMCMNLYQNMTDCKKSPKMNTGASKSTFEASMAAGPAKRKRKTQVLNLIASMRDSVFFSLAVYCHLYH